MPYFKNEYVNILFIHIPKTGGSSVELYFSVIFKISLDIQSLFGLMDNQTKLNKNIIINSSLQHLTFNQIVKYNHAFNIDFNNIQIMTIVRNPYERIISDLFFLLKINVNTTKEETFHVIQKYLVLENCDNHNLPQYIFITDDNKKLIPNIHILRTETLTNDMKALGYENFNLYTQKNKAEVNYYNYLNDDAIKLINDFYHLDFVLFNYTKKTTS
jgi:hypothetical protein